MMFAVILGTLLCLQSGLGIPGDLIRTCGRLPSGHADDSDLVNGLLGDVVNLKGLIGLGGGSGIIGGGGKRLIAEGNFDASGKIRGAGEFQGTKRVYGPGGRREIGNIRGSGGFEGKGRISGQGAIYGQRLPNTYSYYKTIPGSYNINQLPNSIIPTVSPRVGNNIVRRKRDLLGGLLGGGGSTNIQYQKSKSQKSRESGSLRIDSLLNNINLDGLLGEGLLGGVLGGGSGGGLLGGVLGGGSGGGLLGGVLGGGSGEAGLLGGLLGGSGGGLLGGLLGGQGGGLLGGESGLLGGLLGGQEGGLLGGLLGGGGGGGLLGGVLGGGGGGGLLGGLLGGGGGEGLLGGLLGGGNGGLLGGVLGGNGLVGGLLGEQGLIGGLLRAVFKLLNELLGFDITGIIDVCGGITGIAGDGPGGILRAVLRLVNSILNQVEHIVLGEFRCVPKDNVAVKLYAKCMVKFFQQYSAQFRYWDIQTLKRIILQEQEFYQLAIRCGMDQKKHLIAILKIICNITQRPEYLRTLSPTT